MLGDMMGQQITACAFETFHNDVAGKNGFPAVDYAEVDGSIAKEKSNTFNKTEYTYQKPKAERCVMYMNPRYHSNIATAKSFVPASEENREYFFPVNKEVLAGADTDYNGVEECNEIAKGVVLLTREY
jgi:NADH-quinone oxidoreductase subunit G